MAQLIYEKGDEVKVIHTLKQDVQDNKRELDYLTDSGEGQEDSTESFRKNYEFLKGVQIGDILTVGKDGDLDGTPSVDVVRPDGRVVSIDALCVKLANEADKQQILKLL